MMMLQHPTKVESETGIPGPYITNTTADNVQLPPGTQAMYQFIGDLDTVSLHPIEMRAAGTSDDHTSTREQLTELVVHSEIGSPSETVRPITTNIVQSGAASIPAGGVDDTEVQMRSPPRWELSNVTNKSGRAKTTQTQRKKATNAGLKQSTRLVAAVANGADPSVAELEKAVTNGVTYEYATALRALSVILSKGSKIVVAERRNKPPTPTENLRTVFLSKDLIRVKLKLRIFKIAGSMITKKHAPPWNYRENSI
ncbi:unnamed protein product [Phytophthora fragariaefolia]|uniref:Unnamed protein product n=1 Tax=Phytophthora fragariaefolia TaxID=1490495 RepID=A0A9W7D412_9STRA|nr:unnamed protein product [Phytophthora fragariaefolia]